MKWPWQRARHLKTHWHYSRWPKKVYFLDGPLVGRTMKGGPGLYVSVPYVKRAEWPDYLSALGMPSYGTYKYDWETCYPTAEVAYVTFRG